MKYTCPCCGYKVFSQAPGSYDICPICFWEDDIEQLFYLADGGANINLIDAQKNYKKFGAIEEKYIENVRKPNESDVKDGGWRMVDPVKDNIQESSPEDYFERVKEAVDSDKNPYYWL